MPDLDKFQSNNERNRSMFKEARQKGLCLFERTAHSVQYFCSYEMVFNNLFGPCIKETPAIENRKLVWHK